MDLIHLVQRFEKQHQVEIQYVLGVSWVLEEQTGSHCLNNTELTFLIMLSAL